MTGGTGRVGSAIAGRLREDGHEVFAAGRADGDLRDLVRDSGILARRLAKLQ